MTKESSKTKAQSLDRWAFARICPVLPALRRGRRGGSLAPSVKGESVLFGFFRFSVGGGGRRSAERGIQRVQIRAPKLRKGVPLCRFAPEVLFDCGMPFADCGIW